MRSVRASPNSPHRAVEHMPQPQMGLPYRLPDWTCEGTPWLSPNRKHKANKTQPTTTLSVVQGGFSHD